MAGDRPTISATTGINGKAAAAVSAQPTVIILDAPGWGCVETPDIERKVLGAAAETELLIVPPEEQETLAGLTAPCVILWHRVTLPAAFFERNPRCRTVICASVGYDHVDLEAAARHGVKVFHVPHYGTDEVADHTLALALSLVRWLPVLDAHVHAGGWNWQAGMGISRLQGATWGIVGLGRIGLAVARRAAAFGMRVAFHDPFVHPGIEKSLNLVRCHSLANLLTDSQIVSLHVPLTDLTRHMIDADALRLLPEGSVLVNTARGAVIDVSALQAALDRGRPAWVALDVVEGEPELPSWLRAHPQALITPHAAFYSVESLIELRVRTAQAAREILSGGTVGSAVRVG